MRIITDFIIWFIWTPLRSFIFFLPLKISDAILSFCSFLLYVIDFRRRNGVKEELIALYGKRFDRREIQKIVRSSFDLFVKRFFENFCLGKIDEKRFNKIASIEGLEHVKAALEKGKGAILIEFHFGSFILIVLGLAFKGIKANGIGGNPLKGRSNFRSKIVDLRNNELTSYPFKSIIIKSSLLPVVRALKNNEVVVPIIDGRQGKHWIAVKLFKRTALFSPGLVDLAMRTGAPILLLATVKGRDGKHRIIIEPQMELTKHPDREEMIRVNTEKIVKNYEKYLLNYPDHYAMTLYSFKDEAHRGINSPLFIDEPDGK